MMQDCPKCGFSQPKDRYCANCGLDIDAYKPKSNPIFIRLFKSTGVQITAVLILIAAMGVIIYLSQQKTLTKLSYPISDSNVAESIEKSPVEISSDESSAAETFSVERTGKEEIIVKPAEAITDSPTVSSTTTPTKIQIHFVEMNKSYAQKIISENQVLSQSSQTKVLLSKNKDPYSIYNDANNIEILPGQKETAIKTSQAITFDFNYSSTDGNDSVGFTLNLIPTDISHESVEIDMSAIIILKNTQGSAFTTTESNSTFSFSPTNGIIIFGIIPEEKSFEADLALFANSPLNILSSSQFKEGLSEFGMYLSVK